MARYALVIGISEYQSSNLSRLPKTVTDAEAVGQILKQYGDFQIVKRLPERWNQQQNDYEIGTKAVTGTELGQALRTFLLEQAYRSDALIYFSGHGITVSDNLGQTKGYLATSDCVLETDGKRIVGQQHGIALDSLNELIRAAELSSLVLLLDCCHGGYFLERQLVEQTLTAFSSQKDYYIITACRTFEQAWAMHDEKHDVFTGAVLDGLALENAGKDGSVSGDRLFDHISRQLKGKRQEPIRMGWGKSITVVNYPLNENTPSVTLTFNRENPYQGLQAFELGKEKYFFGREQAIWALLQRLNNARFLSVIGRSGCGKSSLVKAGLLPELQSDRLPGSSQWEIEIFTPGIDPLGKLTEILTRRHQENKPFVLFIDQFEEVFTLCNDEAKRQSFMRLMADEATASDRITRVIVAIRGDFLDRCAAYPEAVNLINRTQPTTYVVELLSHSEIVETIEKPAELHGVGFEPGLVSQIAEDVENQPGALPLLQYALSELWRKFCEQDSPSGQPLLTWQDYEEIGGVKGALDNRATILYRSFIPENQAFVRRLFMRLVKLGDGNEVTRRRAAWEELSAIADSPEQLQQIVRLLADQQQRLVITDENTIEVAHEALLSEWKLLRSWIEDNRENIRLKQSLEDDCREWLERFQKSDDALLTGARLAAIEEWVNNTQTQLPPLEAEFLKKSVERRDRELQEKIEAAKREAEALALAEAEKAKAAEALALADIEKSLIAKDKAEAEAREEAAKAREAEARTKVQKQRNWWLSVATIGLAVVAALSIRLQQQAKQREKAVLEALISRPQELFAANKQLEALIESVQVLKQLKTNGGEQSYALNLLQPIISSIRERNRLEGHVDEVNDVSFSPDGSLIASASQDGYLRLWSKEGKFLDTQSFNHKKTVWGVDFSPNNHIIAFTDGDGIISIRDISNSIFKKELQPPGYLNNSKKLALRVKFSPNGQMVASANFDNTVRVWQVSNNSLIKTFHHNAEVNSVTFNSDGRQIASASADGTIKVWSLTSNKDKPLRTLRGHTDEVFSVKFSPDDKNIVSGSRDRTIRIWSLSSNQPQRVLTDHNDMVYSISFSPNGQIFASGSKDGTVKLWSKEGNLLKTFWHGSSVFSVSFSPVDQIIASAGADRSVRLWSMDLNPPRNNSINDLVEYSCKSLSSYLRNNYKLNREERNICNKI
ncbi:caspase family protein [Coleofasciculus sp. FACHB-712]|uniref:nSTAND1 domain-containing NTPase n=1 Tax=Coleofasciculus sp. FACHB-712 TaxID=2692789 RepID=UPI001683EE25|nr:caspase family protein [Coleofasciculus sp. FACHB-712]MBD1945611.1 caspase family protein [Coleofasciculus sp. FACHB-712]